MTSPKFSFSGTFKKLGVSLGLAMLMAFSTWLLTLQDQIDFGIYAPLVGAMITFIVNTIRVYVNEYK